MKKKLSVLLLLVGVGFSTFAQSDCETNYAVYRNEYKQKNYEEALKSWRKVFNECPSYNQNTFANGSKLYQDKIKKDKVNKSAYVDTIMMIYDVRIEIFGKREYVLGLKGADLFKYDASRF
ncbi:MAG: hypothetical protein P8J34_02490, partial [Flavobacteriales bacterium]|nr:hypothetical protein [Flavobacteriales bacterium]